MQFLFLQLFAKFIVQNKRLTFFASTLITTKPLSEEIEQKMILLPNHFYFARLSRSPVVCFFQLNLNKGYSIRGFCWGDENLLQENLCSSRLQYRFHSFYFWVSLAQFKMPIRICGNHVMQIERIRKKWVCYLILFMLFTLEHRHPNLFVYYFHPRW